MTEDAKSSLGATTEHIAGLVLQDGDILQYITCFVLYFTAQVILLGVGGQTKQQKGQYLTSSLQGLIFKI